jgi:hypothetical protein
MTEVPANIHSIERLGQTEALDKAPIVLLSAAVDTWVAAVRIIALFVYFDRYMFLECCCYFTSHNCILLFLLLNHLKEKEKKPNSLSINHLFRKKIKIKIMKMKMKIGSSPSLALMLRLFKLSSAQLCGYEEPSHGQRSREITRVSLGGRVSCIGSY